MFIFDRFDLIWFVFSYFELWTGFNCCGHLSLDVGYNKNRFVAIFDSILISQLGGQVI